MKGYADLLEDDPAYAGRAAEFAAKVRDVSEILVELGPIATRHPLPVTVAYHDACHLAHGQGVRQPPRDLLAGIPGLQLKDALRRAGTSIATAHTVEVLDASLRGTDPAHLLDRA